MNWFHQVRCIGVFVLLAACLAIACAFGMLLGKALGFVLSPLGEYGPHGLVVLVLLVVAGIARRVCRELWPRA